MENHHEPIVSKEEFEKAQSLQLRHSRKSKFDKSPSLLSGFLKCGNCGRNLSRSKAQHGHILYSCAYSKGKEDTGCFAGKADNKILGVFIFSEIKAHLKEMISQEQMDASMRQQHQNLIRSYQSEISDCREKQEQLKRQHRQNYEKYHEGKLDQKRFQDARGQIEPEKEQLQKRIQELDAFVRNEEEILLKKNIPVEQMMEYLEEVYVYDDGRVECRWKERENLQ